MTVSAEQVGFKALEADFFLRKMHAATPDLFEFRCYVSAFVSAVRGIDVAMSAALSQHPEYPAWRAEWQRRLDGNRIARFFAAMPVATQRIGHTPVHLDRARWVRFGLWETKHHFVADQPDGAAPTLDLEVMEACTEYLTLWAAMVLDCYERFEIRTAAALWSVPSLSRFGLTVDDIEESLGFPRGWTAGSDRTDEARLALLRQYSPDAPIDRFFLRYANRTRRSPTPAA